MNKYNEYIREDRDRFNIAKDIYDSFPSVWEEILKTFFDKITEYAGYAGGNVEDAGSTAKKIFKSDSKNIKLTLKFDNNDLAVCVGYYLYCSRIKSDAQNNGKNTAEWSYITKEWFKPKDVLQISVDKNAVIDCYQLPDSDNYIVEWYYKDEDEKKRAIDNLVNNLRRYAKHEF